jgi:hypothetical protein
MLRIAIALALIGSTAACAHNMLYRELNPSPRPLHERPPQTVEMISIAPQRPYVEVALIEALRSKFSEEDSFTALRQLAAARGCDAVVLRTGSDQWDLWRGTCIVWDDAAESPRSGPDQSPGDPRPSGEAPPRPPAR